MGHLGGRRLSDPLAAALLDRGSGAVSPRRGARLASSVAPEGPWALPLDASGLRLRSGSTAWDF